MCEPGGKKKQNKKSQNWEEAGSEFYQERYNDERDIFQKNSCAITTLLPSKQCRIGTTKKKIRTESSKSSFWQPVSSTSHKNIISVENYSSQIPDLSEVLTNEEHIWEQILQIKFLALPMIQKKELKTNLQKATKLRLQGFNQFKWKHRKVWLKFIGNVKKLFSHLVLWKSSLRNIEGNYGSAVLAFFLFIRWLLMLNCITFTLTFLFVMLPTYLQEDCGTIFQMKSGECHNQSKVMNVFSTIRKTKHWKCSFLLYGSYDSYFQKNTTILNVHNSGFTYDISLAYILVPLVSLFLTIIAIVRTAAQEFKDRLLYRNGKFFPFSSIIFAGCDFCIRNRNTSRLKQKAISNELMHLLCSKRFYIDKCNQSKHNLYGIVIKRLVVNVLIFGILFLSVFILYTLFNNSLKYDYISDYNSTQHSYNCINASKVLITEIESIEDFLSMPRVLEEIVKIFVYFMPYIVLVSLNILLPTIFSILCKFEKYSPIFSVKISIYRTIMVRLSSLALFVLRIFQIGNFQSLGTEENDSRCWENYVGHLFYMLALTEFLVHIIVTFCINYPRFLCLRKIKSRVGSIIGNQDFELSKHVLDIVYLQTLCWLGTFYSPFLPFLTILFLFFLFYVKKFQCLVNSKPSAILYGSTRSKAFFMLSLLFSYVAAIIPILYMLTDIKPSNSCGPYTHLDSIWDRLVQYYFSLPHSIKNIFIFILSLNFTLPLFFILILLVYYFYILSDANKNMVDVLRNQLILEGHDKQFLLSRLSYFFKNQNETQNC